MTKIDTLLLAYHFTNELGEPISFTESQREIMNCILNLGADGKRYVQIETPTRFGKSVSVAAAILMRCTKKEQWAILIGRVQRRLIISHESNNQPDCMLCC